MADAALHQKQHRKNPSAAGADTVSVKAGEGGKIEQKNEQKYLFFFSVNKHKYTAGVFLRLVPVMVVRFELVC